MVYATAVRGSAMNATRRTVVRHDRVTRRREYCTLTNNNPRRVPKDEAPGKAVIELTQIGITLGR